MKHSQKYPGYAIVTGASSGIGEAFCWLLAEEGCDLIVVARREERLKSLASVLRERYEVDVKIFPLDLTHDDAANQLKEFTLKENVHVSMLINNAGFGSYGPFHEIDPAKLTAMVELNCRAPVALTSAFLPAMLERKNGAIINVAAYQPTPYFTVYGATKAFDLLFSEGLWGELRGSGVDVIGLSPGVTDTEFFEKNDSPNPLVKYAAMPPRTVAKTALSHLGKMPSVVAGLNNSALSALPRFFPRQATTWLSSKIMHPKLLANKQEK
jgi:short-subunit dehydrogenase